MEVNNLYPGVYVLVKGTIGRIKKVEVNHPLPYLIEFSTGWFSTYRQHFAYKDIVGILT